MYTNVYVCRANFRFFGTLLCVLSNSSSPSLMDTAWTIWSAFHSVSSDGFHLQVFFGREQWLFSSCASNVHNVGPPRVLFRFRQPFGALSEFDAIILGSVDPSRSKSTQVDASRSKSTEFLFFRTFFLISQTGPPADSGSLTRSFPICCSCLGLGRFATDYVGVFPSFSTLTCLSSETFARRLL